MAGQPSRREVLTLGGAIAVAAASTRAHTLVPSAAAQAANVATGAAGVEYKTAGQLVDALAAKRVSAVELTEHCIKRIEALDGKLNAVVVRDFERARSAASEADAALARGERRPLLGLPMTVKESFNVAGLPTTWGVPSARDWMPTEDALTVSRLKRAGAVIIGKTNVPRELIDWQSYNDIYGTTNNPWDVARTPGGSSGGAAAALAAGFVPLELGSDIGGSLRVPAHFCGVFAHKPTQGLIPARGQTPPGTRALPVEPDLAVVGPMARAAADLALALDVLAGPDEALGAGYQLALPPPRHMTLKEFRILVLDTHPLLPATASVRDAIGQLADKLEKTGATVSRTSPLLPDLARAAQIYVRLLYAFFGADLPDDTYRLIQEQAAAIPPEVATLGAEGARGLVLSHRDWVRANRVRSGMAQQWRELFRDWDVVVCPVMPTPAFPHDHSQPQRSRQIDVDGVNYRYDDQVAYATIATLHGLPATAVPIARSEAGLPIGAQIVGARLEDRTTIALAGLIEREFGGFVPPPGYAT